MKSERKYVNYFSKKINLYGITEEELKILGDWYNSEKNITTAISNFHIKRGKINFEKLLATTNLFPKNLKVEVIKKEGYKNGFDFKCKDINGNDLLVHFFKGGTYSGSSPHLTITTKNDIKDYYIGFSTKNPQLNIDAFSIEEENYNDEKRNQLFRKHYNEVFNLLSNTNENNLNTINKESETKKENKDEEKKDFLTKEMVDRFYSNENEITEEEQKGLKM